MWGCGTVLLDFLAGNSYAAIEQALDRDTALVVAGIAVAAPIVWQGRRHRSHPSSGGPGNGSDHR